MCNNIASERRRIGFKQSDLAHEIGVSESTVSRWERGVTLPYGMELIAMKGLFGCSTDYLLGITDERVAGKAR